MALITTYVYTKQNRITTDAMPLSEVQKDLLAGFLSGAVSKVAEYPLDTVKVLMQANPGKYNGPVDCLKQTISIGGVSSLYKGLTSPVFGAALELSTLFVTYGISKSVLNVEQNPTLSNPNPAWKYLVSGGFGGFCVAFVLTPVELIKCNLQNTTSGAAVKFKGPIHYIVENTKANGILSFWKGNVSCIMREVPGNVAWYGVYELLKTRVVQKYGKYEQLDDVPLRYTMICGSFAGMSYWALPYPVDTIKSRIQTATQADVTFGSIAREIYAKEGIRGFYHGCGVTCARAAFSHALLFYTYEVSYRFLSKSV
eukprot:maker-scaffold_12-snap-gene-7.55-mRNA-1 protein AED:0.29 eAED:0.29 QI:31/1/1/1/0/0/3/79/311